MAQHRAADAPDTPNGSVGTLADDADAVTPASGVTPAKTAIRLDLQGMRAIAVLGVVIYHLRASWLPGGFAGVDVFFVLSGFFISGLLFREVDRSGKVNLPAFWGRRARRLLPASTVTLLATVAAGYIVANPLEAHRIARDAMYAVFFGVNWHEAASGLAYGQDPDPSPFQHFWSLGVEEQFYLGWPLIVLALALLTRKVTRLSLRNALVGFAVVAGVASFVLAFHQTGGNQPYAYYGTFGRVWQLALGGALAATITRFERLPTWALGLARLAGLAMVIGFYAATPTDIVTRYPGWWALLPTVGTALVVVSGVRGAPGVLGRVLSCRPAQVIGNYSYSWYLWHWAPLVLLPIELGHPLHVWELIALALITFGAAAITYHVLENPIRSNKWIATRRGGRSLALGALLMVASVAAAQWALAESAYNASHTFAVTQSGKQITPSPAVAAAEAPKPVQDGCQMSITSTGDSPDCRYEPNTGHGDVVLLGDSHAAMWFDAVDKIAKDQHWGLRVWARESCPFSDVKKTVIPPNEYAACDSWRADIVDRVIRDKPSLVIVSSFSTIPLHVNNPKTGAGARGRYAYTLLEQGMVKELARLRQAHIRVLLIADVPGYIVNPPDCVLSHENSVSKCSLPQGVALPYGGVDKAAAEQVPGVNIVDFTKQFCHKKRCYQVVGNTLGYRNQNHITDEMALKLEPQLAAAAIKAAASKP